MKRILRAASEFVFGNSKQIASLKNELHDLKLMTGQVLAEEIACRGRLDDIRDAEFKVFSQFGEDGIIHYLVRQIGIPPYARSFVEFGVETYSEANTVFLLKTKNWRGLIIDGSAEKIRKAEQKPDFWRHNLTTRVAFIDRDNINDIIKGAGFEGELGLLSVDIDGNDYWIWESISVVSPIIVVCEYNSVFGPSHAISVPYDANFVRTTAHNSNLYWGCSIKAWEHLAKKKGYALVGSNSAGNNAFFVRSDRLGALQVVPAEQAWVDSQFRESRGPDGRLTYLQGPSRLTAIQDLPVIDVVTGKTVSLRHLR